VEKEEENFNTKIMIRIRINNKKNLYSMNKIFQDYKKIILHLFNFKINLI